MKNLLLTFVTSLTLASPAWAASATLNPNFQYEFQKTRKLPFCPGVEVHVMNVHTLGATWSGGSNGYDEDVTQAEMNGPLVRRDMRADVEFGVRHYFDWAGQDWDASISKVIPVEAQLVEQLPMGNGKVSVCVSQMDLESVDQDRAAGPNGTEITFYVAFRYFVTLDTPEGRKTLPVWEASGERTVHSNFYNFYYDGNPRAQPLMPSSWAALQADIGSTLIESSSSEAQRGLASLKMYLGDFIGPNGQ